MRSTRTQILESLGVCFTALARRFSTIRSTIVGVRLDAHRARVELEPTLRHGFRPGHELADERPEIDGTQSRREAVPLEPVEVQQVRHDPVESSRVLHDPGRQVSNVLGRHVLGPALERDGQAQDRGEGCPDVVRDRLQCERLGFVGDGQEEVLRALGGELVSELVHATAIGDVHEHTQPVARDPLAVA